MCKPCTHTVCNTIDKGKRLMYNLPMTQLLLKLFVKNHKDVANPDVREKVGKMAGLVCIVLNLLLAAAKIAVGAVFSVVSVLADGMNNLTDCGSNVVSLVSIKLANKPADSDHPYGHRRMEYVAGMIVSFIVLMLAFELASQSVSKIVAQFRGQAEALEFSLWTVASLCASLLVKLWMFFFNGKLGKRYSSQLLAATATDSISDVFATAAVLVALLVSNFANVNLDGAMGLAVSVFIAIAGIKIFKETVNQLLGEAPSEQLVQSIVQRIKQFDGVRGLHDLNVHNYGPDKYYASVHVEVDAAVDVMESHDLTDRIERDFAQNTNITLVTHLDPVVVGDQQLEGYKKEVLEIVKQMDQHFDVHDFRMVKGPTHTNVIFDVAIHFDTPLTPKQIADQIKEKMLQLHPDVYAVPTVERQLANAPKQKAKGKK